MKRIYQSIAAVALAVLMFAISVSAQTNYRLKFAKGKTSAIQMRSIKAGAAHDIFFRAKKGQRVTIAIASTGDQAKFSLGAMNEFDVNPIQEDTFDDYAGRLPFAGTGEYVIRVTSDEATKYTLTVTIK